jgi:hypothetical protein
MRRYAITFGVAVTLLSTSALAHHVQGWHHKSNAATFGDQRPSRWCGWWMRHHLQYGGPSLNLAINWAHVGMPAPGPAPGVIGVNRHHVFQVVEVTGTNRVLAISGNDGKRVRIRERRTNGVVAWRRLS